jgi:PIN domain nuclease of toxin-antitoxin system
LPGAAAVVPHFDDLLRQEFFESLPITAAHATRAGLLPGPHKDPFDRMLVAQSQAENLPIVSSDVIFDTYKVRRLWR